MKVTQLKITLGHELEAWYEEIEGVTEILRKLGYYYRGADGSGPEEYVSIPVSAENPWNLGLVGAIIRFDEVFVCNDYDCRETAGQHIHIAAVDVDEDLIRALRANTRAVNYLFSVDVEVSSNAVQPLFTERRRYWAKDIDDDCGLSDRCYRTVTYNDANDHKPATIEFRVCETWPLLCAAGALVALAAVNAGYVAELEDGEMWEERRREEVLPLLEAAESGGAPEWALKIAEAGIRRSLRDFNEVVTTVLGLDELKKWLLSYAAFNHLGDRRIIVRGMMAAEVVVVNVVKVAEELGVEKLLAERASAVVP